MMRATFIEGLETRMLLAAGAIDTTFGSAGKVIHDLAGTSTDAIVQAGLQSDGKIIVLSGAPDAARLTRYSADGVLDKSFGSGGTIVLPARTQTFAVRPDNRVIVACFASAADQDNVLLARYTANGMVDSTFGGGDGQTTAELFGGSQTINKSVSKLLIRSDNRILIVGAAAPALTSGEQDFAVSSFTEAGDADFYFGDQYHGATLTDFGGRDWGRDVALTPDGKIVVAGQLLIADSHHPWDREDFAVARYTDNGLLDSTFGQGGKTTISFGSYYNPVSEPPYDSFEYANAVAVGSDGKITLAGLSQDAVDSDPQVLAIARLTSAGVLDKTFDSDGKLTTQLGPGGGKTITQPDLALMTNGRILVSSSVFGPTGNRDFAMVRFNASGTIDSTFGSNGRVRTDLGGTDVSAQLLLQNGKPMLVGATGDGQNLGAIVRYLGDQPSPAQTPYGGTPLAVAPSAILQFENFDDGGEGIAYHDLDSANLGAAYRNTGVDLQNIPTGGQTLAFTKAGEWTEYTINVANSGTYSLSLNYASLRGGGQFHIELDGQTLVPVTTLPTTGDWQKYITRSLGNVSIPSGIHVLRLVMDRNDSTGYMANFENLYIAKVLSNPAPLVAFSTREISEIDELLA